MKVRCIVGCDCIRLPLFEGRVYEVISEYGDGYDLKGAGWWFKHRFQILPNNACFQCGEIHQ
jgi:hypothetical protein